MKPLLPMLFWREKPIVLFVLGYGSKSWTLRKTLEAIKQDIVNIGIDASIVEIPFLDDEHRLPWIIIGRKIVEGRALSEEELIEAIFSELTQRDYYFQVALALASGFGAALEEQQCYELLA